MRKIKKKKLPIGRYGSFIQKKGKCEACLDNIKDGEAFFTIQLEDNTALDVKSQADAEIISRLVRIEQLLRRRK